MPAPLQVKKWLISRGYLDFSSDKWRRKRVSKAISAELSAAIFAVL